MFLIMSKKGSGSIGRGAGAKFIRMRRYFVTFREITRVRIPSTIFLFSVSSFYVCIFYDVVFSDILFNL